MNMDFEDLETYSRVSKQNIVFSSTAAAYGSVNENKLVDENTNLNPQNPYAESKIKTEKIPLSFHTLNFLFRLISP